MRVPANTLANISPPDQTGYEFFQRWETEPLEPIAFSKINAWRFAEIALLSYDNKLKISQQLRPMTGFEGGLGQQSGETEYLLLDSETDVILSFRGTEIDNLAGGAADWFTDFRIRLKADADVRIHEGFTVALDRVWGPLLEELKRRVTGGKRFWITGHSLGAALATLAAYRLLKDNEVPIHAVYTYGSPRVGDARFRDFIESGLPNRVFRVRNNADLITRMPPFEDYCHVGVSLFIDNSGHLHENHEPPREPTLFAIGSTIGEVLHVVPSLAPGAARDRIMDGAIADHSPTAYTIHLFNQTHD